MSRAARCGRSGSGDHGVRPGRIRFPRRPRRVPPGAFSFEAWEQCVSVVANPCDELLGAVVIGAVVLTGAGCEDRTRHLMITKPSRTVRLVSVCTVACALIRHDAISRADWCCLVSASIDSFVGNPWARRAALQQSNRCRGTAPEYPSLRAGRGSLRHHHGARRRPHCRCETWDSDPSPGGDG
jgi:hypothetical protein